MSGLVKRKFFHRFTTVGTYTIPTGVTMLWIEAIGPGGGGGGGGSGSGGTAPGGGGGGGSSMTWGVFNVADLSATLTIIIQSPGTGGALAVAGAGGGRVHVGLIGNNAAGVDTSKYILSSYGGGGGYSSAIAIAIAPAWPAALGAVKLPLPPPSLFTPTPLSTA